MKIGLVVPHIFMHRDILPGVIFSPASLALGLADGLQACGVEVVLCTPGPVSTTARNVTADLSLFERELAGRGYDYVTLLKKHPMLFVTLARQVQAELIANTLAMANRGELDLVHIYTNEEDIALPMAQLCTKPVVFTHHDPFNFLIRYKNTFPKFKQLNWISMSLAQRSGMPAGTNWVGNVYHGLPADQFAPQYESVGDYVAYLGRIIEPKGVHLAIEAVNIYNQTASRPLKLKIAGKHYAGAKDTYWQERIKPSIDNNTVEYVGFINTDIGKQEFLRNARALLVPSLFNEPFGMVLIEALACGTPVIGLDSGAIPEIIRPGETGFVIAKAADEHETAARLAAAVGDIPAVSRRACRTDFESRFTLARMCQGHADIYRHLIESAQ